MKRGQATKGKTVFGSNVLLLALPWLWGVLLDLAQTLGNGETMGSLLWSSVLGGDGLPV